MDKSLTIYNKNMTKSLPRMPKKISSRQPMIELINLKTLHKKPVKSQIKDSPQIAIFLVTSLD